MEWQQEVEKLQVIRLRKLAEELPQVIVKIHAPRTVSAFEGAWHRFEASAGKRGLDIPLHPVKSSHVALYLIELTEGVSSPAPISLAM